MEYLGLLRELGEINDFQSEHSAQAAAAGGDEWASSLLDVSQHVLAADRIVRAFTLPAAAFRTAVRQVCACEIYQKPRCCLGDTSLYEVECVRRRRCWHRCTRASRCIWSPAELTWRLAWRRSRCARSFPTATAISAVM